MLGDDLEWTEQLKCGPAEGLPDRFWESSLNLTLAFRSPVLGTSPSPPAG